MLLKFFNTPTTPNNSPSNLSQTSNSDNYFNEDLQAIELIKEFRKVCEDYINSSHLMAMTHTKIAKYIITQLDALCDSKSDIARYYHETMIAIFLALKKYLEANSSKTFILLLESFSKKYPEHFSNEKLHSINKKYLLVISDLIYFLNNQCELIIKGEEAKFPIEGIKQFEMIFNKEENEACKRMIEAKGIKAETSLTENQPPTFPSIYRSQSSILYSSFTSKDLASSSRLDPYHNITRINGMASFTFTNDTFIVHIEGKNAEGTFIEEHKFTKIAAGRFSRTFSFIEDPASFNLEKITLKESRHYSVPLLLADSEKFITKLQEKLNRSGNFIQSIKESYQEIFGEPTSLTEHHRPRGSRI